MVEYRDANIDDYGALYACMLELQEFEKQFEPYHRPGHEMAQEYLEYLDQQCNSHAGKIIVAVASSRVIGFVCVWRNEQLDEYMSEPFEIAYISDLVVCADCRGQGVGAQLVQKAERFARDSGLKMLKIGSLSRNHVAKDLYHRLGFRDYAIQLVKELK